MKEVGSGLLGIGIGIGKSEGEELGDVSCPRDTVDVEDVDVGHAAEPGKPSQDPPQ